MQGLAVCRGLDIFPFQILDNRVAARLRKPRSKVHRIKEPVRLIDILRGVWIFDAFERSEIFGIKVRGDLAQGENFVDTVELGEPERRRKIADLGLKRRDRPGNDGGALLGSTAEMAPDRIGKIAEIGRAS